MRKHAWLPALVLVFAFAGVAEPLGNTTNRVSTSTIDPETNGSSVASSVSAEGRFVAFRSDASNLVANDSNGRADIFVRDRITGILELVSLRTSGSQAPGAATGAPAISANGRYVVWDTAAYMGISQCYDYGVSSVYVRDRVAGTTACVSLPIAGVANGSSYRPAVSDDGRYIGFVSLAGNLVAGASNQYSDVYVRDTALRTTERLSIASDGSEADRDAGDDPPALTSDGRYVAFVSAATNLVPGFNLGVLHVFVRDRSNQTTEIVSVSSAGVEGNQNTCFSPDISADGRYVVFASYASNLVADDTGGQADVFLRDRQEGTTVRINVPPGGGWANGDSCFAPENSGADGRFIAYVSRAGNLVPGGTNGMPHVFVHDRTTGSTWRANVGAGGAQANAGADRVSMSPDGYWVAFDSPASNLVSGDTNNMADVFVRSDSIAPATQAVVSGTLGRNGWYRSPVGITLTAADDYPDGYGLDYTEQQMNRGGWTAYNPPVVINRDGRHFYEYRSADLPGNIELAHEEQVNIDQVPPALVFGTLDPAPNAAGWNNSAVAVPFEVSDTTSGPGETNPASPIIFSLEGTEQSQQVVAFDAAGNSVSATSPLVNINLTGPSLTHSLSPQPNAFGWNNGDVKVSFEALDARSGIAAVSEPVVVSTEGYEQKVTGTALDQAGNRTEATFNDINIDRTPPVIAINSPSPGPYLTSQTIVLDFDANDVLSGLGTVAATLDGQPVVDGQEIGFAQQAGTHTFVAAASDLAGNEKTSTVTFVVDVGGIVADVALQPPAINRKSNGKAATMFIEFPAPHDVGQIDVSSIRLTLRNGTPVPVFLSPTTLGDYDRDGIPDRMVKVDLRALIAALGPGAGSVDLGVTGLAGNMPFIGLATVAIK